VVGCNKRFIYIFVGLLGSINGSRFFVNLVCIEKAQHMVLFDIARGSQHEISLYILGDKGYPLISWIMTPFKEDANHTILKFLYNKKHKRGQSVVDLFFEILKITLK
jgi:hypothetical protein